MLLEISQALFRIKGTGSGRWKMGRVEKHHYLPQFYLRDFSAVGEGKPRSLSRVVPVFPAACYGPAKT